MSNTLRMPQASAPAPRRGTVSHPRENHRAPRPGSVVYLIQEPTIPKYNAKVIDTSPLLWWGKVKVLMERTQIASFPPRPGVHSAKRAA